MNKSLAIILGLLALVMGVGAIVALQDQGAPTTPASERKIGQPLLPQLKAADVARITIREPKGSITLEKKNERWVINERAGFPADLDKVTEIVVKAIELKTGQVEGIGAQDRVRMQLAAPAAAAAPAPATAATATSATTSTAATAATAATTTEGAATALVLAGADGKPLAELWLGKKYFKTPPEGDAAKALGDGRFVMLPADQTRVVVVADPLKQATSNAADWLAREGVTIENVKSIEIKATAGGYRLARVLLDTPWELDGAAKPVKPAATAGKGGNAAAGPALDQSRANSASYALAKLDIDDVAAAGADAGFEQGSEIIASTFEGLEYRIKVGRLDGARYFAQVSVQGAPSRPAPSAPANEKPEDKDQREKAFAEQTKTFNARIAREKALGPFTLLIAKAKFDDLLKPREALLAQPAKDAKK